MCETHVEQLCGRRCSVIRFNKLYFLFKKTIVVIGFHDVSRVVATVTQ
jgi:hypothetical protein